MVQSVNNNLIVQEDRNQRVIVYFFNTQPNSKIPPSRPRQRLLDHFIEDLSRISREESLTRRIDHYYEAFELRPKTTIRNK